MLERVDVNDFLTALGVVIESRSGENALFCCPWHRDMHPSARMNVNTTAWLCSAGCGKGNAIHFLAKLRQLEFDEARDHIYARYGIGPGAPIDDLEAEVRRNLSMDVKVQESRVPPDESWVDYLAIDWEVTEHPAVAYMIGERGFSPAALSCWNVGFDPLSQRVTIPVRTPTGVLVGFKARAIDPERYPRYLVLGDSRDFKPYGFDPYRKSECVFGLDRWASHEVVLVEGELNAIAMWEKHGIPAVAVAGSEFSETQRELIASRFNKVTIYFDDDVYKDGILRDRNPGRLGAAKVAGALQPFITVDVVLGAPGDAVELETEQVCELIATARPAMELAIDGELDLILST